MMWQILIILAMLSLIFFIWSKVKGAKKKKIPAEIVQSEADKKSNKDMAQTNTNLIKVILWKPMGDGGLVAQITDPFIAEEKLDNNNNSLVIQDEKRFKEDLNFSKDRIYEVLEYNLKVQNKNRKEKAVILDNSIKLQEELVKKCETDSETSMSHNLHDENLKLRQLRVLREHLQMETAGNYMRLAKGGVRQYEFVVVDGILYPYFFGSRWYRVYPDLTIKKKIFNQENTIFKNEVSSLQKGLLNWITVITLIIGIVLTGLNIFAFMWILNDHAEFSEKANAGAITCQNTLATIQQDYGGVVSEYLKQKSSEAETIKNPQSNNNLGTIGNIIVDPGKVGN